MTRGFTAAMGTLNPREKNVSVAAAVRGVACDQPVQLPDGARAAGPAGAAPGGREHGSS